MRRSLRSVFPVLSIAAPICAVLALWPTTAGLAQSRAQDLDRKVARLEEKVATLESEVTVLRERLQTLLGLEPESRVFDVPVGASPQRGAANAPITLVMFGDYQSDYTARAQHVVSRLLKAYPQRLRFVYKHYPLTQVHPLATEAALAALAAERQEAFWSYHDQLFQHTRRLDSTVLLVLAEQGGLDITRFDRDRRSLWALERLAEDEQHATQLDVAGVPTLFLNGRKMATWRYDYLERQIARIAD